MGGKGFRTRNTKKTDLWLGINTKEKHSRFEIK